MSKTCLVLILLAVAVTAEIAANNLPLTYCQQIIKFKKYFYSNYYGYSGYMNARLSNTTFIYQDLSKLNWTDANNCSLNWKNITFGQFFTNLQNQYGSQYYITSSGVIFTRNQETLIQLYNGTDCVYDFLQDTCQQEPTNVFNRSQYISSSDSPYTYVSTSDGVFINQCQTTQSECVCVNPVTKQPFNCASYILCMKPNPAYEIAYYNTTVCQSGSSLLEFSKKIYDINQIKQFLKQLQK